MLPLPIVFFVRLDANDFSVTEGCWRCPALRIPGATIEEIRSKGESLPHERYKVDSAAHAIFWIGDKPPESIAARVVIAQILVAEEQILGQVQSAKAAGAKEATVRVAIISGIVSIVVAVTTGVSTYYGTKAKASVDTAASAPVLPSTQGSASVPVLPSTQGSPPTGQPAQSNILPLPSSRCPWSRSGHLERGKDQNYYIDAPKAGKFSAALNGLSVKQDMSMELCNAANSCNRIQISLQRKFEMDTTAGQIKVSVFNFDTNAPVDYKLDIMTPDCTAPSQ